jgi:vacuolar iron transporter family protein
VPVTLAVVLIALALTGSLGAYIGGGSKTMPGSRVVIGGALALAATFAIGRLLGASGIV